MKTRIAFAATLAAFLAGCHGGKVGSTEESGGGTTETTSGPTFGLHLLGTDRGDFRHARLEVAAVQVKGPTGVLATKVMTTHVDLAQPNQAWLLSIFQVPAGVDDVDFVVSFASGQVETAQGAFDLETGCSTLQLTGKVKSIAQRKHAVIQMDVARSMLPAGAGVTLVPQYQLVY